MKKVLGLMLVGMLVLGTVTVNAGSGCCSAGGATKATECFAKLNLTAEQKTKVEALLAECKTTGCTTMAQEKMTAGLKTILTPEQYTQWTAACEQAKGNGKCPFTSKAKEGHTDSKN